MFEKTHKPEHIISAHAKQARFALGEGGVSFTPEEQAVLANSIPLLAATNADALPAKKDGD